MNKNFNYQGVILSLNLDPTQPFGVSKIKEAVRFAGGIFQDIKNALSDGRLSWIEGIRIGLGLSGLKDLVRGFEQIKNELADLSETELIEVANEVMLAFDWQLQGDRLQILNQKILPVLAHVISMIDVLSSPLNLT